MLWITSDRTARMPATQWVLGAHFSALVLVSMMFYDLDAKRLNVMLRFLLGAMSLLISEHTQCSLLYCHNMYICRLSNCTLGV